MLRAIMQIFRGDDNEPECEPDQCEDRMLNWFEYSHLPKQLQTVSRPFHEFAVFINKNVPRGPERTVAFRKLLESKDAAVRALVRPGG